MSAQSEALRLADALEISSNHGIRREAAAELRRLSEIETLYLAAMRGRHAMSEELLALTSQRDALLEALKLIANTNPVDAALDPQRAVRIARVAIAKAEEST